MKNEVKFNLDTDERQFERVAYFTVGLVEDIYCNTLKKASGGDSEFTFLNSTRYSQQGHILEKINGKPSQRMPKMLVYDWNAPTDKDIIPPSLVIAFRGTHSLQEWEGNFDFSEVFSLEPPGVFHSDFRSIGIKCYNLIKNYIVDSTKPIIFTGHSRGGALAEVVTVIAKYYHPDKEIYCFAYAPPPSMYLTQNVPFLTKGIYGFVNNQDSVPHFFLEEVLNALCSDSTCRNLESFYQSAGFLVNKYFSNQSDSSHSSIDVDLSLFLGGLVNILSPVFTAGIDSYAVRGIINQKDKLFDAYKAYKAGTLNVKIKSHIGVLYHLRSFLLSKDKSGQGITMKLSQAKLSSPEMLPKLKSNLFKMARNKFYLDDHYPGRYRHAIQDPISNELINSNSNSALNFLGQPNQIPTFIPEINDDDLISVGPLSGGEYHFVWNSYSEDKQCFGGLSSERNDNIQTIPNNILWVKCIIGEKLSSYNNGVETTETYNKFEDQDNRCIIPEEEGMTKQEKINVAISISIAIIMVICMIGIICIRCGCCNRCLEGDCCRKKDP